MRTPQQPSPRPSPPAWNNANLSRHEPQLTAVIPSERRESRDLRLLFTGASIRTHLGDPCLDSETWESKTPTHRGHPERTQRAEGSAVASHNASISTKLGAPCLASETWESKNPNSPLSSRASSSHREGPEKLLSRCINPRENGCPMSRFWDMGKQEPTSSVFDWVRPDPPSKLWTPPHL
jgi:hypothetical protein